MLAIPFIFDKKSLDELGIGYPTKVKAQRPALENTYRRLMKSFINKFLTLAMNQTLILMGYEPIPYQLYQPS